MKIHLPLTFLLFLTPLLALAGEHYPFVTGMERHQNIIEVVAHNRGPASITAIVRISVNNCTLVPLAPPRIAVKPWQSLTLARIKPLLPGRTCQSSVSTQFGMGDFTIVSDGAALRLPFADGNTFIVGQAFGGPLSSHSNINDQHALDINMPERTPIVAARDGVIVECEFGFTNNGGLDIRLKDKANHVLIQHSDGSLTQYAHLSPIPVSIKVGSVVHAGQLIGYSGNTGYSSGPHLHFAVLETHITPDGKIASVAVPFWFYAYRPRVEFIPTRGMPLISNYTSSP